VDAPVVVANTVPRRPAAGTVFLRLLPALVTGVLAGTGVTLAGRGLWTLATEPHGHCGGNGLAAQPCPTGTGPILGIALPFFLLGVPVAIAYAIRGRWVNRGGMRVAGVAGVLAGQAIFGAVAGTALPTAWSVPSDRLTELSTVGSWQYGGSVIWVRGTEPVSYDAATGQRRWILTMPRGSVACAVSQPGSPVGLIGYGAGQPGQECAGVLAVDLRTGQRLWTVPLPGTADGVTLLVAGDSGVINTDDGLIAVQASTGARRWSFPNAHGCTVEQAAASQGKSSPGTASPGTASPGTASPGTASPGTASPGTASPGPPSPATVAALVRCGTDATVTDLDAATGRPAWTSRLRQAAGQGELDLLSADPVVITDWVLPTHEGTGPDHGGSKTAIVFSASGQAAAFPIGTGDLGLQLVGEGFNPSPVVADGMLIGISADDQASTSLAGYRLADGRLQLHASTSDDYVNALAVSGDRVYFTDQVIPALFAVSVRSGALWSIGNITGLDVDVTQACLYPVGRHYILVNPHATGGAAVIAAITGR